MTTSDTNPIIIRFDIAMNTALLFTLRQDNRLIVDVLVDNEWKGQKVIADWS